MSVILFSPPCLHAPKRRHRCAGQRFVRGGLATTPTGHHRMCMALPPDLSIVGFCDGLVAQLLDPPLTTVTIPMQDLGRRAMELLLSGLETELPPFVETVSLDFVVRESTAPPREDPLLR